MRIISSLGLIATLFLLFSGLWIHALLTFAASGIICMFDLARLPAIWRPVILVRGGYGLAFFIWPIMLLASYYSSWVLSKKQDRFWVSRTSSHTGDPQKFRDWEPALRCAQGMAATTREDAMITDWARFAYSLGEYRNLTYYVHPDGSCEKWT